MSSPLGDLIYNAVGYATDMIPETPSIQVADLGDAWETSVWLFLFTWFQPLLLRLDGKRTIAWIAGFTGTPVLGVLFHPYGLYFFMAHFAWLLGGAAAVISTALLYGQRTPPWFGIPAGFFYGLSLELDFAINTGSALFANIVLGIILILGTRRIRSADQPARDCATITDEG